MLVKQQLRVFTNISAINKNRQDRAGAEWIIHLAPVFLWLFRRKTKVLLIFYEEGSKIIGFMYIIEHATQERNTREVTDR